MTKTTHSKSLNEKRKKAIKNLQRMEVETPSMSSAARYVKELLERDLKNAK